MVWLSSVKIKYLWSSVEKPVLQYHGLTTYLSPTAGVDSLSVLLSVEWQKENKATLYSNYGEASTTSQFREEKDGAVEPSPPPGHYLRTRRVHVTWLSKTWSKQTWHNSHRFGRQTTSLHAPFLSMHTSAHQPTPIRLAWNYRQLGQNTIGRIMYHLTLEPLVRIPHFLTDSNNPSMANAHHTARALNRLCNNTKSNIDTFHTWYISTKDIQTRNFYEGRGRTNAHNAMQSTIHRPSQATQKHIWAVLVVYFKKSQNELQRWTPAFLAEAYLPSTARRCRSQA